MKHSAAQILDQIETIDDQEEMPEEETPLEIVKEPKFDRLKLLKEIHKRIQMEKRAKAFRK